MFLTIIITLWYSPKYLGHMAKRYFGGRNMSSKKFLVENMKTSRKIITQTSITSYRQILWFNFDLMYLLCNEWMLRPRNSSAFFKTTTCYKSSKEQVGIQSLINRQKDQNTGNAGRNRDPRH